MPLYFTRSIGRSLFSPHHLRMKIKLTKRQKKNRAAQLTRLTNQRLSQSPKLRRAANVKADLERRKEIKRRANLKAELEAAKKAGKKIDPAPVPLEQLVGEIASKL